MKIDTKLTQDLFGYKAIPNGQANLIMTLRKLVWSVMEQAK
jgi:hypothetical protein